MPLPPLRFRPILKARTWGGQALAGLGKTAPAGAPGPWGESWEIADLAPPVVDGVSRVQGGAFDGCTLTELMRAHRRAVLGTVAASEGDRFPLLVKFLDAAQHLSVQVHPTAAYAARHPGAHLKTEAWVVLDAAPGAVIYRGLRPGTTPDAARAALADGSFRQLLLPQAVQAGDCIALESGLCHALGAGVVVAEVQTPSDTTFRLYDWDRHDPARPLHLDAALECMLLGQAEQAALVPVRRLTDGTPWTDGLRAATLCTNECFSIEAIHASPSGDAEPFPVVTDGRPVIGILCRGEAVLRTAGHPDQRLRAGDTVLFPADLVPTTWVPEPDCLLLHATLPHPADRIRDGLPHGQRLA